MLMAAAGASLGALGKYALRVGNPGPTIGPGAGRAASAFIRALGASGIDVRGVPTSTPAEELGRSVGIPIVTLAEAAKNDTHFDVVEQFYPRHSLIKGYDGALEREKFVAASSRRFVVLVGYEKIVKR